MPKSESNLTYDDLRIGTVLCDMHDGLKHLSPHLECDALIVTDTDKAHAVMCLILESVGCTDVYTNKMLVVVGYGAGCVKAAYSYDGIVFGMARIIKKESTDA